MKLSYEKVKDGVFGAVVGDALGVPFEGKKRGDFVCDDMIGQGFAPNISGAWTDDSSMLLCLFDSLKERGFIDFDDIMRRFCRWFYEGAYTPYGAAFGTGVATREALRRYRSGIPASECGLKGFYNNGNGSLMRTLPLAFTDATDDEIERVSSLTHAHEISKKACVNYVHIARRLMGGEGIESVLNEYGQIIGRSVDEVHSSGFVVHTFEAAVWCLANTSNYRECVLSAVNLGGDTDTTACVVGGLAGIAYGYESIPEEWLAKIQRKDFIEEITNC